MRGVDKRRESDRDTVCIFCVRSSVYRNLWHPFVEQALISLSMITDKILNNFLLKKIFKILYLFS